MPRRQATSLIVVHCSATRPQSDIGAAQIREWHLAKGWQDIGYHFVVRRDGRIEAGRHPDDIGSHVAGFNSESVSVCMVGGLDEVGDGFANRPDLFTAAQWESARAIVGVLRRMYPKAVLLGHRDLSPDTNKDGKITQNEWLKTCPGFNAKEQFK